MGSFAAYYDVWSRLNLRKPRLVQVETALGCSAANAQALLGIGENFLNID